MARGDTLKQKWDSFRSSALLDDARNKFFNQVHLASTPVTRWLKLSVHFFRYLFIYRLFFLIFWCSSLACLSFLRPIFTCSYHYYSVVCFPQSFNLYSVTPSFIIRLTSYDFANDLFPASRGQTAFPPGPYKLSAPSDSGLLLSGRRALHTQSISITAV